METLYEEARKYKSSYDFIKSISKDESFKKQYIDIVSNDVDTKTLKVKELLKEKGMPQATIDAVIKDLQNIETNVLWNMDNKVSRWIVESVFGIKLPKTKRWTKEAIDKIYKGLESLREEANKK